ncbi:hypothetical protein DFP72DRAFT_296355 [Ephemerocybe angulata]|uniref:Uncharacterized protein n=1 Tax=Ephemerocybe angulata TaxID=980116 RepID=A0A8H6I1L1_9AGAR|nr:hypothetical protein DFP72DRAFT_296355 [Tulosesus angulatus]
MKPSEGLQAAAHDSWRESVPSRQSQSSVLRGWDNEARDWGGWFSPSPAASIPSLPNTLPLPLSCSPTLLLSYSPTPTLSYSHILILPDTPVQLKGKVRRSTPMPFLYIQSSSSSSWDPRSPGPSSPSSSPTPRITPRKIEDLAEKFEHHNTIGTEITSTSTSPNTTTAAGPEAKRPKETHHFLGWIITAVLLSGFILIPLFMSKRVRRWVDEKKRGRGRVQSGSPYERTRRRASGRGEAAERFAPSRSRHGGLGEGPSCQCGDGAGWVPPPPAYAAKALDDDAPGVKLDRPPPIREDAVPTYPPPAYPAGRHSDRMA